MKKKLIALGLMAVGAMALAANKATTFAYQGVLLDQRGLPPANGQAGLTFRVYDRPTGGVALWTSSTLTVPVATNGLFSVEVNGGEPLASALVAAALDAVEKRLYLGVTVEGAAGEINPRQELGPVPLAAYAQDVRQAKGSFSVGGDLTLSGPVSVNANKVFRPASLESRGTLHTTAGAAFNQGAYVNNGLTVAGACMANGVSMDVPPGTIVIWNDSSRIPSGWLLCDTNKTVTAGNGVTVQVVDLRGRFVVGAGSSKYPLGKTGGAASVTLTLAQIPNHTHLYSYDDQLNSKSDWQIYANPLSSPLYTDHDWLNSGEGQYGCVYETGATGESNAHENRPPFYSLCYIIKVN